MELYCIIGQISEYLELKLEVLNIKFYPNLKVATEGVANMIINSDKNKEQCRKIATIMRLADYGNPKNRAWYRAKGVFAMRNIEKEHKHRSDKKSKI